MYDDVTRALLLAHVARAGHSAVSSPDLQAAWQAAQAEDGSDPAVRSEEETTATTSEDEALEWRGELELCYKTEHHGEKEHYDLLCREEHLADVKDWAQAGELSSDTTADTTRYHQIPPDTTTDTTRYHCRYH